MFRERLHKGYAQSMELTQIVAEEKSRYQRIKIFDTVANGRVMVLDDIVQITTRDESAYAEMLTHLPLLEHGKGECVMIVGGGNLDDTGASGECGVSDCATFYTHFVEIYDPENDSRRVRSDLLHMIDRAFAEAGIRMPFPQRDLHIAHCHADTYAARDSGIGKFSEGSMTAASRSRSAARPARPSRR